MMNLDLYDKTLDKQINKLKKIILSNKKIVFILKKLQEYNLDSYYLGAGCISQTVFNYYHGYNLDNNINDYDIVYFDNDLSYEKELAKWGPNLPGFGVDQIETYLDHVIPKLDAKYTALKK